MFRNLRRTMLIMTIIIILAFPYAVRGATHVYDYCKEATCTNKAVYDSKYCSMHVCKMDECTEKAAKEGYCFKHKSWASKKNKKPDQSSNRCMVNGCTMYRSRGWNYCLSHTCNKTGCRNQKVSGSVYCKEHKDK